MNTKPLTEFTDYVAKEVTTATAELGKITADAERKHLQRLVYTNLVDRFDTAIDTTLIKNAAEDPLRSAALAKLTDPLPEGKLLELLASKAKAAERVSEKCVEFVRSEILRNRHSKKLGKLFEVLAPSEKIDNLPRVNISTGKVSKKITPTNNKIPTSICGYADWLYSRRNSVVHGGGGNKLLANDVNQLKNLYKADPAATVKLSLGSISIASTYYQAVVALLTK